MMEGYLVGAGWIRSSRSITSAARGAGSIVWASHLNLGRCANQAARATKVEKLAILSWDISCSCTLTASMLDVHLGL